MNKLIPVILAATLVGCASEPEIEPTIFDIKKLSSNIDAPRFTGVKFINAPIDLVVNDARPYKHIAVVDDSLSESLVVLKADNGFADLYSDDGVAKIFKANLTEMLTAQGYKVNVKSTTSSFSPTYSVKINDYKVTFDDSDYLEADVSIELDLINGNERLYKRFSGNASYKPSALPTPSDIEHILKKVMENILSDMATNQDINTFAKNHFERY